MARRNISRFESEHTDWYCDVRLNQPQIDLHDTTFDSFRIPSRESLLSGLPRKLHLSTRQRLQTSPSLCPATSKASVQTASPLPHYLKLQARLLLRYMGPTMLCKLCARLEWKSYGGICSCDHHLSYEDLVQAAKECELCALLAKAALLHYNLKHPQSTESAEEYHQRLDTQGNRPFTISTAETAVDYDHTNAYLPNYQTGLQGYKIRRPKDWYSPNGSYETCGIVSVSSKPGM